MGERTASRRSSAEVRGLIRAAALRLFAEKGYAGTSTAEIAAEAGVAESVIFRRFGDKKTLFAEAALEPFGRYIEKLEALWRELGVREPDDEAFMLRLVTELYGHVKSYRAELRSLLLAGGPDVAPGELSEVQRTFARSIDTALVTGALWEDDRGVRVPRLWLRIRLAVAMVTASVLFEDWFLGSPPDPADRLSDEDVIAELAGAIVRGLTTEAPPPTG